MQARRRWGAVSAGSLVAVGAVAAALINELHGGWVWWVLAAVVVAIWAVGTGWLYWTDHAPNGGERVRVASGAVATEGRIGQKVETRTHLDGDAVPNSSPGEGVDVSSGGVFARGGIDGPVRTDTSIARQPRDAFDGGGPPGPGPTSSSTRPSWGGKSDGL